MSYVGFKAQNHPQQVSGRGAVDSVDDRGTDPKFFSALDAVHRFTVDVAASTTNTKCERFYTLTVDGLSQSWAGERVWCNPPYSDIRPWVEKAAAESADCPVIVQLLPANRCEQKWWQDVVEPIRDKPGGSLTTQFLRGRLRFVLPGQTSIGANQRPPFGCCLLVWRPYHIE